MKLRKLVESKKKFRLWLCKAKLRYHNAEQKAKNVVRDLHYKAAHFLLTSYKTIFYPNFNARAIAQSRKLNSKTKRRLNMLSFYKFSQRLVQSATFYKDAVIKRGSEAYTKTNNVHIVVQ